MSLSRSGLAGWLLGCVLPRRELEIIIGDLEEEYALRCRSTPDASRWYWIQVFRSLPPLLWAPVRRGGWLPTLGVALAACVVQALVELTTKLALVDLLPAGARSLDFLTLLVTLPSFTILSYLATRVFPGAATMLAGIVLFAVFLQVAVQDGQGMTIWTQLSALCAGPSMAFTGGVFARRTRRS